jgi:hypothetical protein
VEQAHADLEARVTEARSNIVMSVLRYFEIERDRGVVVIRVLDKRNEA